MMHYVRKIWIYKKYVFIHFDMIIFCGNETWNNKPESFMKKSSLHDTPSPLPHRTFYGAARYKQ